MRRAALEEQKLRVMTKRRQNCSLWEDIYLTKKINRDTIAVKN